jgi:hypothetical protein
MIDWWIQLIFWICLAIFFLWLINRYDIYTDWKARLEELEKKGKSK